MGNSDSKVVKIESPRPCQYSIKNSYEDTKNSIIQFEIYCRRVRSLKEVIYDTNGNKVGKPLTNHELKIVSLNLRKKYKDLNSKISFLRKLLEDLDSSFSTNHDAYHDVYHDVYHDAYLARNFLSEIEETKFNKIYPYKSAYINALKSLGIP